MSDPRGLTYLRAPDLLDTTSLPIGGDHAFTDAATVYVGPLGPGTYTLTVAAAATGLAGYWTTGPWDTGDSDVVTELGGDTAYVPDADDEPVFDAERLTFEVRSGDYGIALIGASGASGTFWIRRT